MSTDAKAMSFRSRRSRRIAVAGSKQLFPVRRIWCVGRNYLEHIKEMGQDVREPPFFFAKPADAIVPDGGKRALSAADQGHAPRGRAGGGAQERRPQYQGRAGARLIWGYGVGIDLTRRDLQIASRDIKRPWEIGKAFDALGALRAAAPGVRDRPSEQGPHQRSRPTARSVRTAISIR